MQEAAPLGGPFQLTCVPKKAADRDPLKQDIGTQVWLSSEFSLLPPPPAPCSSKSWALGNGTCEAPVTASLNKRVNHPHTLLGGLIEKIGDGKGEAQSRVSREENLPKDWARFLVGLLVQTQELWTGR